MRCAKGCVQGCYGVVLKCLVFIAFGMCFVCVSCVCHTVPSGVPPVCAACVVTYRRHQPFEVAYLSQREAENKILAESPRCESYPPIIMPFCLGLNPSEVQKREIILPA